MQTLDIVIALPLLFFCYKGAVNGIIKEILNIVGLVLAVFLTFNYMDAFGAFITPYFEENPEYTPYVSGILLFLGTLITFGILATVAKKFLEAVKLGFLNRLAGALFGVIKAAIFVSAILLLFSGFKIPSEESIEKSLLYEYVIKAGPLAYETVAIIYPGAEGFTETIKQNISKYNPAEDLPLLNNK